MIADIINASFELLAGLFIANNCRCIVRDKEIKGVSAISILFFTFWGYWNLYYYPSLGQIWSFIGGIVVVSANTAWIGLIAYYRIKTRSLENGQTS